MKGSLCFIFAWIFVFITHSRKLLLVQEVFRHGARNSEHINNHDFSNISREWKSVGELTTQGKNMHYLLGKEVYKKYWADLFGGTPYETNYNQSKFYVKSTNYNRTIESAESHLMGIFSNLPALTLKPASYQFSLPPWPTLNVSDIPAEQWYVFEESGKNFHPVPVHVEKIGANQNSDGDFLLSFEPSNCPRQELWMKQNFQTQQAIDIKNLNRVKQAIAALEKEIGIASISFQKAKDYIDNQRCLKDMQVPYVKIFEDPRYRETFDFIKIVGTHLLLFLTPLQKKIAATRLFGETMHNMQRIINDSSAPQLVIYSGHDTTVISAIAALNMTNIDCIYDFWINGVDNSDTCIAKYPVYATTFIIELWEDDDKSHSVKMLYNGVPRKIPFCNWQESCSLQRFQSWYRQFRIETVMRDCGIQNSSWNLYSIIGILGCILFVMIFGICYQRNKLKAQVSEAGHTKIVHIQEKDFSMNEELSQYQNQ